MKVDHNALRTNQATIITLLVIAYLANQPILVLLTGLIMLAGSIFAVPGFKFVYTGLVLPSGLAKPDVLPDDPASHRFAQTIGSLFLLASSIMFLLGNLMAGWILAGVVVVLASVNLFAGFCLGCFMYFQLGKLGIFGTAKNNPN